MQGHILLTGVLLTLFSGALTAAENDGPADPFRSPAGDTEVVQPRLESLVPEPERARQPPSGEDGRGEGGAGSGAREGGAQAGGDAAPASPEVDPWEGFNRRIFNFNEKFDRYVFKPAARGYRKVTPDWLDDTVTRFFENLRDLRSGLNNVLQWEWGNAGNNFGRFGVNTTLGVAGLFDVASDMNLRKTPDDLSATLAVWGVPQGSYLVLPFLGPSSVRDAASIWPEEYMTPRHYIEHDLTRWSVTAVYAVDLRADLLDLEKAIVGDRYTFIRDAWLAHRRQIIGEAPPEDDFGAGAGDFDDEDW